MKKFLVFMLALLMCFCNVVSVAMADGEAGNGDIEYHQPEGWPDRHWFYLTDAEIAQYEDAGWERYVGVLWYHGDEPVQKEGPEAVFEIELSQINQMYNNGDHFDVIYHWMREVPSEFGGKTEQTVYVGRWVLSRDQVSDYYENYQVPAINGLEELEAPTEYFITKWYLDGKRGWPEGEDVAKATICRESFNCYDFGYGSNLYLKTGVEYGPYSYDTLLERLDRDENNEPCFNNEMPYSSSGY